MKTTGNSYHFNTVDATNANIKSVATLTNINKDSATFDFNNVIDF